MALDIFSPQISVLSYDLSGKTILVYGTNRVGKTRQLTRLPKPCYLAFEAGINGIAGVPFFPMRKWSDYVQFVKQITNDKNISKAKEIYQTIILDEASIMGRLCTEFVCEKHGVDSIREGNKGYGLWKEYSDEFGKWLNLLTSVGFTVAFIAHEGTRDFTDENGEEYSKIYPAGDKRIIDPICNLVDIISYAAVNGTDDDGNEIKSSLFLTNTRKYHAGSRFDYLTGHIPEFTAENLQAEIAEAIKKQEEAEGIQAVDYETQAQSLKSVEKTYAELKEDIKSIAEEMFANKQGDTYKSIVEEHLGKGKGVQDTDSSQRQLLELILADLQAL
jgi:hypothetical protein